MSASSWHLMCHALKVADWIGKKNSARLPFGARGDPEVRQWCTSGCLPELLLKPVRSREKHLVLDCMKYPSLQHLSRSCYCLRAWSSFLLLSQLNPGHYFLLEEGWLVVEYSVWLKTIGIGAFQDGSNQIQTYNLHKPAALQCYQHSPVEFMQQKHCDLLTYNSWIWIISCHLDW